MCNIQRVKEVKAKSGRYRKKNRTEAWSIKALQSLDQTLSPGGPQQGTLSPRRRQRTHAQTHAQVFFLFEVNGTGLENDS